MDNEFVCKFCGKICKDQRGLSFHQNGCRENPDRVIRKIYSNHKKIKCKYCDKEIDVANIKRHENSCKDKIDNPLTSKLKINFTNCPYCGYFCENKGSLAYHIQSCKSNPNRIDRHESYIKRYENISEESKEKMKWNKGLTKETDFRIENYASKIRGRKNIHNYLYEEHNLNEINKWLKYLDSKSIDIPEHTSFNGNNGYVMVSKVKDKKLYFEHNYIMNYILENFSKENTVHHIDKNGLNNSLHNLMVFKTNQDHKRFHNSKYAYLIYDEVEHMFSCSLLK